MTDPYKDFDGRVNPMDVKDYRKAYEAELAAPRPAQNSGTSNTFGAAAAPHEAARLAEIQRVPLARDGFGDKIPALIATLRNGNEFTVVRLAALRALRAAMFLGDLSAPFRADFLAALRQLAQQGTDPQLCEGALAVSRPKKIRLPSSNCAADYRSRNRRWCRRPRRCNCSASTTTPILRSLRWMSFKRPRTSSPRKRHCGYWRPTQNRRICSRNCCRTRLNRAVSAR